MYAMESMKLMEFDELITKQNQVWQITILISASPVFF